MERTIKGYSTNKHFGSLMKGFCPLASGSKGNCIYFGTSQKKVLIDAGISGKQIKERLEKIGVGLSEIDAILITHEHHDHIAGLKVLALKYGIPVFANSETAKGIVQAIGSCPKFKIFSTGESFEYGDMEIHPFTIQHDTVDPVAFTIQTGQHKFGFCTDLGFASSLVTARLKGCEYLYLEANHEPEMVNASCRPVVYKQRVLGRTGHLSNEACGMLLREIYHDGLKHVHLAHLSSECNTYELALEGASQFLEKEGVNLNVSVAHQGEPSRFIQIDDVSML